MLHTKPHRKYQSVLHNSLFCTHQNALVPEQFLLAQGELEAEGRLKREVVLDICMEVDLQLQIGAVYFDYPSCGGVVPCTGDGEL